MVTTRTGVAKGAAFERANVRRLHHGEPAKRHALCRRDQQYLLCARISTAPASAWYETYADVNEAIAREKQLKKWERKWKLELIEQFNPEWRDWYETLNA